MFAIQMKKSRNVLLLLGVLAYTFLLVAAPLLHDHHDADHHDDCPVCQWALICAFTFPVILAISSHLYFCRRVIPYITALISSFCNTNLCLRSPPVPFDLSFSS